MKISCVKIVSRQDAPSEKSSYGCRPAMLASHLKQHLTSPLASLSPQPTMPMPFLSQDQSPRFWTTPPPTAKSPPASMDPSRSPSNSELSNGIMSSRTDGHRRFSKHVKLHDKTLQIPSRVQRPPHPQAHNDFLRKRIASNDACERQ